MPSGKITKRTVDALQPAKKDVYLWDTDRAGFGVKVTPSGRKVYLVQYRIGGKKNPTRRVTIGVHGNLTADEARDQARSILAQVSLGNDPAVEKAKKRKEDTIAELTERYFNEHVKEHNKDSTAKEVRRIIDTKIIPKIGSHKINELTRAHVKAWHYGMRAKPYEANRALAYCSKMMSLASGDWELRLDNPCHGVKKFPEKKRERFFSEAELKKIGEALDEAQIGNMFNPSCAHAIRLLALTGCRLGEILSLTWGEVDIPNSCIRLKDAKTGARIVPLGLHASTYLEQIPKVGDFVVHSIDSDLPLSDGTLRRFWDWIKEKAKLGNSRPHDFRHTAGTYAAQAGFNAFIVRDLLGHKTLAMTGRYVERSADPLKIAANAVAGRVADAMVGLNSTKES
jgi:integrase